MQGSNDKKIIWSLGLKLACCALFFVSVIFAVKTASIDSGQVIIPYVEVASDTPAALPASVTAPREQAPVNIPDKKPLADQKPQQTEIPTAPKPVPVKIKTEVEGRAAYVYDLTAGKVLYAKNETEILPLASLTKIMTSITALGSLSENDTIALDSASIAMEGNHGLVATELWSLGDLLRFMLIVSSNDAATAIEEAYQAYGKGNFIEAMNANAVQRGFDGMRFVNPTGLDENPSLNGGYGSAKDVARLLDYAVGTYPGVFRATSATKMTFQSKEGNPHTAYNTDTALSSLPDPIASKTGFTLLAGGNIAVEFNPVPNHPVIIVVLGSSAEGRFSDLKFLAEKAADIISGEQ